MPVIADKRAEVVRRKGLDGRDHQGSLIGSLPTSRHPGFHKTNTVDYAVVLEGEIGAMMDLGETLLKTGDVLVQRRTNHSWSNRSN